MPPAAAPQAQNRAVVLFVQIAPLFFCFTGLLYLLLPGNSQQASSFWSFYNAVIFIVTSVRDVLAFCINVVTVLAQFILAVISFSLEAFLIVVAVACSVFKVVFSAIEEGHWFIGFSILEFCSATRSSLCLPVVAFLYISSVIMLVWFALHMCFRFFQFLAEKYRQLAGYPEPYLAISYETLNSAALNDTPVLGRLWSSREDLRQRKFVNEVMRKSESSRSLNENSDLKNACVVCLSNRKHIVLLPCRHLCVCGDCASAIREQSDVLRRKCPLCRTHISQTIDCYV